MEKIIDFIRIILLIGLVFFVFQQNKTINQLETRIVSLNNHITDIGEFLEGHEIAHENVTPIMNDEVGDLVLDLMEALINKIDEDID